MDKFILLILTVSLIANPAFCQSHVDKINAGLKKCYANYTSHCFKELYKKYDHNQIRYFYAQALFDEKRYEQAKNEFELFLKNENTDIPLVSAAKNKIQEINDLFLKMKTANNLDAGDYFNSLEDYAKWEKPHNIKVLIKGFTKKESILSKAFEIWDYELYKFVNFSYVNNEDEADIICYFVEQLEGQTAGVTHYAYKYQIANPKKKFFSKAKIEIALKNPQNGYYTDDYMLGIALHEIGHALGITAHSDNINDIMYPTTNSYKTLTPSNRDVNTVRKIYRN